MTRYIDAYVAIYKIVTNKNFIDGDKYPHDCCCDIIEAIPTADVVEVVRCKDCKYRDPEDERCDHGAVNFLLRRTEKDYCSYGERRE